MFFNVKIMKKKSGKKNPVVKVSKQGRQTALHEKNFHEAVDGNNWWERRAKHGRDKIFASADVLMKELVAYVKWNEENPEKRAELVKYEGEAKEETVSVKRLMSIKAFCIYLGVGSTYFRDFRAALRVKDPAKLTQEDMDFSAVINVIDDVIETQQLSGAASGFFNGNIISRLIGLVDRKDITTDGEAIQPPKINVYNNAPPLASNEDEIKP